MANLNWVTRQRHLIVLGMVGMLLVALWIWLMRPLDPFATGISVLPGEITANCTTPYYIMQNHEWWPLQLERVSFAYERDLDKRFPLPARLLAPGAKIEVWSRNGTDDADKIYLGQYEAGWRINGFVALLDGERILGSVIMCDPAA